MTFDEIMKEITSGLTGDSKTDIAYLRDQAKKYKEHEFSNEILRACGRLVAEFIPAEDKAKFAQAFSNDVASINAVLEEAHYLQVKKEYDKALSLMEPMVEHWDKMLEEGRMFADDSVSAYFCFKEPMEEYLYVFYKKPKKTIRRPDDYPFVKLYLQYGSLLIDLNRIDEAQVALAKAVRWNPTSLEILSEYAETFKIQGNMDKFLELTLEGFKVAFTSLNLARCYRNLGFYFVEKQLWTEAIGCYLMSMQFDKENRNAQSELYYIHDMTKWEIKEPTMSEFKQIAEKYGFPIGAHEDVLGLAYTYGKHFYEEKMNAAAVYFLKIVYDLTDDEGVMKMLESLPEYNESK